MMWLSVNIECYTQCDYLKKSVSLNILNFDYRKSIWHWDTINREVNVVLKCKDKI